MAVESSDNVFEALFLALPTAVFVIKDGRMQRVNQAFADLLGTTPAALAGRPINELIAPEDVELVTDRYKRRLAGEDIPSSFDFKLVRADGSLVPVRMQARVTESAGEPLVVGSVSDISDERTAELQLMAIARGAPIVVSAFDREGTFKLHIGRGLAKLGLEENQLVGASVYDAFKGVSPPSNLADCPNVLAWTHAVGLFTPAVRATWA